MRLFLLLFLPLLLSKCETTELQEAIDAPHEAYSDNKPMEGVTFVAPPHPFPKPPMPPIQEVGADWIAIVPYAFTRQGQSNVFYGSDRQWWGERVVGIEETIRQARAADIQVLLKPQVYIPGSWTGDLTFPTTNQWERWEAEYEDYILQMARLAAEQEVEVFCVGTEFKKGVVERTDFWRQLIQKVRTVYDGKLVYAANWDAYQNVTFWEDLDYIGVNAYFPLDPATTPTVSTLRKAWQPIFKEMEAYQKSIDRPIVFTEFGYLSVDGCAYNTWELEGKVKSLAINEQAQANAYQALFETFWKAEWWYGGFIWKWFPNMEGGEGYNDRDYTPQFKKGEETLQLWYMER
ncbi:MAG: hypothetical protein AAGI23_09915 [Bacteroidota bacterium]